MRGKELSEVTNTVGLFIVSATCKRSFFSRDTNKFFLFFSLCLGTRKSFIRADYACVCVCVGVCV